MPRHPLLLVGHCLGLTLVLTLVLTLAPAALAQGGNTPHVEPQPDGSLELVSAYPGDRVRFTADQLGTRIAGGLGDGAQKPFAGVHLTLVTLASGEKGPISGPLLSWTYAFHELTGATIDVVQRGAADLASVVFSDQRSNAPRFDGFVVPMSYMGGLVHDGLVAPLNDLMTSDAYPRFMGTNGDPTGWGLDGTLLPNLQRLYRWGDRWYAVPLDSDGVVLYYRRDVLENPDVQERYRRDTGQVLKVPATLDDLVRQACYFDGKDVLGTGHLMQGILQSAATGSEFTAVYRAILAQYEVVPAGAKAGVAQVLGFDPSDMKPRIDGPAALEALKVLRNLYQCGDDTPDKLDAEKMFTRFAHGDAVFQIAFGDTGMRVESTLINEPKVRGHLGVAALPGTTRVYDVQRHAWDTLNDVHAVGNTAGASWSGMVSAKSAHRDAAYAFFAFLASPPVHGWSIRWGFDGIDLGRVVDFLPPDGTADLQAYLDDAFDQNDMEEISGAFARTFTDPVTPPLRIPGAPEYDAALRDTLQQVIVDHAEPQQALHALAQRWNEITDEHGRKDQVQWLQRSLK